MKIQININEQVRVKITPEGERIHRAHWAACGIKEPPAIQRDKDGWSTMQLHDVMSIFGAACYMGGKLPIETNIEFEASRY